MVINLIILSYFKLLTIEGSNLYGCIFPIVVEESILSVILLQKEITSNSNGKIIMKFRAKSGQIRKYKKCNDHSQSS